MDIIYKIKKECFRRRLSLRTTKTYVQCIKGFLFFINKEPRKITKKDVKQYLDYLAVSGKSGNTINTHLSAVKFMITQIIFKTWKLNLKYSRTPKKLPVVLSKKEIAKLLNSIENKKHLLIVSLLYSAGLRLSEVINLKVGDLEIDNGYGWVRSGKGNKDRMFIIANKIKDTLKNWVHEKNSYLLRMSRQSIYRIVKHYGKKAGIKKNIHPHTLRHSFATHLIDANYQMEVVQRLLGHGSPEATQVYIHTSIPKITIQSPLDTI